MRAARRLFEAPCGIPQNFGVTMMPRAYLAQSSGTRLTMAVTGPGGNMLSKGRPSPKLGGTSIDIGLGLLRRALDQPHARRDAHSNLQVHALGILRGMPGVDDPIGPIERHLRHLRHCHPNCPPDGFPQDGKGRYSGARGGSESRRNPGQSGAGLLNRLEVLLLWACDCVNLLRVWRLSSPPLILSRGRRLDQGESAPYTLRAEDDPGPSGEDADEIGQPRDVGSPVPRRMALDRSISRALEVFILPTLPITIVPAPPA
jgi:hypothetical protein